MKKPALLLLLAALVCPVAPARAQEPDADTMVAQSRKSTAVAGVLEWVLPTLGFAYAGDWPRGLLPNAVRVVATVGAAQSLDGEGGACDALCTTLLVAGVGSTIWAIVGATRAVDDHNAQVRTGVATRAAVRPGRFGAIELAFEIRRRPSRP